MKEVKGLYVIINTTTDDEYSPIELARKAIDGGADVIQFKDKEGSSEDFLFLAKGIKELCLESRVIFIVKDRVDVAEAVDADGVDLRRGDFPISVARSVLGKDKIIGVSAENLEEARQGEEEGADYIKIGNLFSTQDEEGFPPGLEVLEELCTTTDLPVIAFGGISEDNLSSVLECGAAGVAVISAVSDAEDPQEDTQRLKNHLESFSRSSVYVGDR